MAPPILTCGPCREWGEWVPITTDPHFPQDDYIFWTPEHPDGIDEPNCKWWYEPQLPLPAGQFYLNAIWFNLFGRHCHVTFPTTTNNLKNGTYKLYCDIVNIPIPPAQPEHCTNSWTIYVP
jgi:hypothetical protein